MKFKTTIKITSEAENEKEAMEIVGEYLSGNIVSGVDMNCATRRVIPYAKAAIEVAVISVFLCVFAISFVSIKAGQNNLQATAGMSAIQPPLKTSSADLKNSEFKKKWQTKQDKELLNYIKK